MFYTMYAIHTFLGIVCCLASNFVWWCENSIRKKVVRMNGDITSSFLICCSREAMRSSTAHSFLLQEFFSYLVFTLFNISSSSKFLFEMIRIGISVVSYILSQVFFVNSLLLHVIIPNVCASNSFLYVFAIAAICVYLSS